MRVRLKDIADDLKLSVVTISKVLRNHPDIAQETRDRVLKRIKELDYQPNIMARGLVTGRSYLIGLVVPDLLHPFFAELAKALSAALAKGGYSVIISSSEEDAELEAREIQQLMGRRLDALVVASTGDSVEPFLRLERNGLPYVLIDREIAGLSANFVGINDETAGRIATEHLIDQGCKRIAHIRGRENSTGVKRFEGYRKALRARRIPYLESLVIQQTKVDSDSEEMGAHSMRELLARRQIPDGVFAHNDPLAIGAMEAILEAGLRIPEDIALIGCGNLHYGRLLKVPLSSVDQNSQRIGQKTAEILLKIFQSKAPLPLRKIVLEPTLQARASSLRKRERAQANLSDAGKEKSSRRRRSRS